MPSPSAQSHRSLQPLLTLPSRPRRARRLAAGALLAAALASAGGIGPASGASASGVVSLRVGCSAHGGLTLPGEGKVTYRATCLAGRLTLAGVVTDTADDGRCLQLSVAFPDGTKTFPPVCGAGDSAPYSATGSGTLATLRVSAG